MRRPRAAASVIAVLAPLLACAAATGTERAAPASSALRAWVEESRYRQAYGISFLGRKVGWLVEELALGTHEGREVAVATSEAKFVIRFAGQQSAMEVRSTTMYGLEGEGPIVHAEETTIADGSATEYVATREGGGMRLSITSGGEVTQRRLPLPKETLRLKQRLGRWLEDQRSAGDTFVDSTTEWAEPQIDVRVLHTFREEQTIAWGGIPTRVFLLDVSMQGIETRMTLGEDGIVLEGKIAGVLELRAEKELLAKRLDEEPLDMLAASAVAVDEPLGEPSGLRSLTLRVRGAAGLELPVSARQQVRGTEDGGVLVTLLREPPEAPPEPLDPARRERLLAPTAVLASDHPKITGLAETITAGESKPRERAARLASWVHGRLRKSHASNASTALEVLSNGAGDCTEHAMLFVALARAAGIPAQEVGGIAYIGDEAQLFGWHAWAEIHDGERWISVDPTWNQLPVDPSHVKVTAEPDDWSWVNAIGRIELELVELNRDE